MLQVAELKQRLDSDGDLLLLDVRVPKDYGGEQGHIAGSRNIPVEEITRDDFPLPSIGRDIDRWIDTVQEGRGLLLLTGFPVDRYSKEDCGIIYYGLGTHFGEAQSQSTMGDRLGHVVDIGGKDTRERAYRNSVELSLHTDASDIVALLRVLWLFWAFTHSSAG